MFVYGKIQNVDMEVCDPEVIVYLTIDHNPNEFLQKFMTSYLFNKIFFVVQTSGFWFFSTSSPIIFIWLKAKDTSAYTVQFGYSE